MVSRGREGEHVKVPQECWRLEEEEEEEKKRRVLTNSPSSPRPDGRHDDDDNIDALLCQEWLYHIISKENTPRTPLS